MINNKFNKVVRTFIKKHNKEGLEKLSKIFVEMEENFHLSLNTKLWHAKGYRSRIIWTPIGDLIITRRIYEQYPRRKQSSKILFDKHLGLEPYQYLQKCFYKEFIMCLNKVYAYKTLTEIFGHNFSTSTISKVLKTQKMELVPKRIQTKTKRLILNVDDIYVLRHKQPKTQIRGAIAYTSVDHSGRRGKLINKVLIPIDTSLSTANQVKQLENTCKKVYEGIKEVIIVGDGTNWITNYPGYSANSKAKRYIDSFHYHKYVKGPTKDKNQSGLKLYIDLVKRGVLELFACYNSWWKWCSSI